MLIANPRRSLTLDFSILNFDDVKRADTFLNVISYLKYKDEQIVTNAREVSFRFGGTPQFCIHRSERTFFISVDLRDHLEKELSAFHELSSSCTSPKPEDAHKLAFLLSFTPEMKVQRCHQLYRTKKVAAISGGYLEPDEQRAAATLVPFYEALRGKPVAVLTGGTDWSLPGLATSLASSFGFKTIGVLPKTGVEDKARRLDFEIVIDSNYGPSEFGDETPVFVKAADALVVLGGGPGAGSEICTAVKMNSKERPIHIVGIRGFGGILDTLAPIYNIPLFETGADAANALIQLLEL